MTRSRHLKHTGRSPARAGFTRHGLPPPLLRRDHPRSRGVYSTFAPDWSFGERSSPLARGLLPPLLARDPNPGIIPARAGFTRPSPVSSPRTRDHPRSRGVYDLVLRADRHGAGSSPLARGLPAFRVPPPPGGGIIPARAGFTRRPWPTCWRRADHPRSRGVYRTTSMFLA